ncbi:hypothetical protein AYJ66_17260 [Dietzia cinnamea]|nr:hypothetical protein AYJ66_17260 [Dietzia cinnamea]
MQLAIFITVCTGALAINCYDGPFFLTQTLRISRWAIQFPFNQFLGDQGIISNECRHIRLSMESLRFE